LKEPCYSEKPLSYVLSRPGDSQKLQFLLYWENNFTAPCRDPHRWVNVSGKTAICRRHL
jgi:uncharacterized membrane protein